MKSILSGIIIVSAALFAFAACSDDKETGSTPDAGSGGGGGDGGGTGDGGGKASCTPKGQAGNDKGVGKYCDTVTDCEDNQDATICSEIDPEGKGSHFCTVVCDGEGQNDKCGADAVCQCNAAGSGCGCTPNRCLEN